MPTASEAPGGPEARGGPEAPGGPEARGGPEAPGGPEVPGVPDVTDRPAAPDEPVRRRLRPRPLELVLLACGLALVTRYAWVMDDAFVYARYADNALLLKQGLVYNAGEYVEGFSSPLWMLWILLWRGLGLSYWAIWLASGWLGLTVSWWALIQVDRALAPRERSINLPLAFLAVSYPVTAWFTSGMETSAIQACAIGFALLLVEPRSRLAGVLVGLAPLVRAELAAPFVIVLAYLWLRTRRPPWLPLGLGLGLGIAWEIFRVDYYADLLPNTFYLKHQSDLAQGRLYLIDAFHSYHLELLLLAVALLSAWVLRHGRASERATLGPRAMMWVASVPVILYVVRIGGDAIHYRFLAFPFCLSVCSSAGLLESWWSARPRRLAFDRFAGAAAIVIAATSFTLQPPQRDRSRHALFEAGDPHKVHEISDPGRHRRKDSLRMAARVDPHREAKLAVGRAPDSFTYAGAELLGGCAEAYVKWDRRVTHRFGLTDPFLARMEVPQRAGDRPGHSGAVTAYAHDVLRITSRAGEIGPGMMRRSLDDHAHTTWVAENLETLELVERKAYNRHRFADNLELALSFPPPIRVHP